MKDHMLLQQSKSLRRQNKNCEQTESENGWFFVVVKRVSQFQIHKNSAENELYTIPHYIP